MNSSGGAAADASSDDDVEIDVSKQRGVDVVSIVGDLDVQSSVAVKRVVFDATVCAQTEVLLDLSRVRFMDSIGVGTLLACRRQLANRAANLSLVVVADSQVGHVVRGMGLGSAFPIHPSAAEALSALGLPEL